MAIQHVLKLLVIFYFSLDWTWRKCLNIGLGIDVVIAFHFKIAGKLKIAQAGMSGWAMHDGFLDVMWALGQPELGPTFLLLKPIGGKLLCCELLSDFWTQFSLCLRPSYAVTHTITISVALSTVTPLYGSGMVHHVTAWHITAFTWEFSICTAL